MALAIEELLDRLVSDSAFRDIFSRDRVAVLGEYDLTPPQVEALTGLDLAVLEANDAEERLRSTLSGARNI